MYNIDSNTSSSAVSLALRGTITNIKGNAMVSRVKADLLIIGMGAAAQMAALYAHEAARS